MASPQNEESRLTILFVDQGASFGGSVVVIANLVRSLSPLGFRCIVVGEVDRQFILHHVGDAAEIHVLRHGLNYVTWARLSRVLKRIPTRPLRAPFVIALNVLRSLANSAYLVRLAIIAVRERIDIIHINNGAENFEANLLSIILRCPQIVHVHGFERLTSVQRWFLRRVRRVVAISESVAAHLLEQGLDSKSLETIPNPVRAPVARPNQRSAVRERLGIAPDARVFGVVGRIVPWKGQLEFLKAAVLVLSRCPNAQAIIVGDPADGPGDYLRVLKEFIHDNALERHVIFAGFTRDVSAIYEAMDVLVHSSIEPEPFGLVITEAMSHGLPVVASVLGAPSEIIEHGTNGFLVHPTATDELALFVSELIQDPHLRMRIGCKARESVLARYDARLYAVAMERVYRTL